MKLSERIGKSMDDAVSGLSISWPIDEWADEVAQLEAENEALRLDRNLYDKGWDKALDRLRIYRELLSEVGDYFKHLGMDSPARLASKVFDALLTGENDE